MHPISDHPLKRINWLNRELLGIKINAGDHFVGLDCCNESIDRIVTMILKNTVVVECDVENHLVKKSEIEKNGQLFDGLKIENKFNLTPL